LQQIALLRRERAEVAIGEHLGVAGDHVERRAQLVRHGRDELRFEPVRACRSATRRSFSSAIAAAWLMPRASRRWRREKGPRRITYPLVSTPASCSPRQIGTWSTGRDVPAAAELGRDEGRARTVGDLDDLAAAKLREQRQPGARELDRRELGHHLRARSDVGAEAKDLALLVEEEGGAPVAIEEVDGQAVHAREHFALPHALVEGRADVHERGRDLGLLLLLGRRLDELGGAREGFEAIAIEEDRFPHRRRSAG
jgi:hypothetical protein